ncbi:MAG: Cellulose synthase (UDP-forming) [Candidatus Ozemobacter sibiricus]|uniref:Cellulose synthase (UDP-forming) n=1 Tax=Candidatus Ozemobacter sibiricus TaxID=2268124 RepID=A0A367ZQW9_9BACT|nr:MAG: Cellulose synthase (UDP-forming) [Candidatus Ozemobacter sibiricus]
MASFFRDLPSRSLVFLLLAGFALVAVFTYLIVRTALFFLSDYLWFEKALALALLLAEGFILVHGVGYFLNLLHLLGEKKVLDRRTMLPPPLTEFPPIAVLVPSYHEPPSVLENTLTCFYNLTYPNKRLYLLDDTRYDLPGRDPDQMAAYRRQIDELAARLGVHVFRRRWRGAKAGIINDFLDFLDGHPPEGATLTTNGPRPPEPEKYLVVFDADMNPLPGFAEPLVAMMEQNPRLAFIQTPQYYSNFETNRVAHAAGMQQAVFYEYICEGKSLKDAMFCCGTNVIFRREALMDVGKFDEQSVTEDFATSLRFHQRGWSSAYRNFVSAFGMGPEDLGGFFKQQFRWALGTTGLFRRILAEWWAHPRQLSAYKWWEYFLSGTHYFIGWALFVMFLCPVLYLLFEVPSYFAWPGFYFLFFTPYIILSMTTFFWTLTHRKYRLSEAVRGQLLLAISFPVYMRASLQGLLGIRGTFQVTPKAGSVALPLTQLWPQLTLATLSFVAAVWGANRLWFERQESAAILANMFWCLCHSIILYSVLYFNDPDRLRSSP